MPRGFKPKGPQKDYGKKKRKEKRRVTIISTIIVIFLISLFGVMILYPYFPRASYFNTVYEADLVVTGALGEGFTSPSFGVKTNQTITVKITTFKSNGVTLKVDIQGGGNYWQKIVGGSSSFSRTATNGSVYSVQFSINTLIDIGGNISFHVKIYLGG